MKLGDKIKYAREQLGMTQSELADKLYVSQSFVTHIENNRRIPKMDKMVALSKVLEVPLDYLVSDDIKTPDIIFEDKGRYTVIDVKDKKTKFVDYAVVVDKAIARDITPEELDKAIEFIEGMRKTQGH